MIAHGHVSARFDHKQAVIDLLKKWDREIGPKAGIVAGSQQIVIGSIGAKEAELQIDMRINDLAELESIFAKLGKIPEHGPWGVELEPLIVSGSTYWEVFRVVQ